MTACVGFAGSSTAIASSAGCAGGANEVEASIAGRREGSAAMCDGCEGHQRRVERVPRARQPKVECPRQSGGASDLATRALQASSAQLRFPRPPKSARPSAHPPAIGVISFASCSPCSARKSHLPTYLPQFVTMVSGTKLVKVRCASQPRPLCTVARWRWPSLAHGSAGACRPSHAGRPRELAWLTRRRC